MKKNIIYIGQWNRNTYNGHGKMWWYPNYEALENQDDTHAQTYTGDWINNKHQGSGEYYWPGKKQTFKGCLLYTSPSPRDGLLSRMPSSA